MKTKRLMWFAKECGVLFKFIETSYESENGINIYRGEASAGFILQVARIKFRVRWSKRAKMFFWGFI